MSKYINHIITDDSIIVVFDDKSVSVRKKNALFSSVRQSLLEHKFHEIEEKVDLAKKLEKDSNGIFSIKDGDILVNGQRAPKSLAKKIIEFVAEGLDCQPLLSFLTRLNQNPLESAKESLYDFLEHNHHPITRDGCFIAYKRLRSDFYDVHTGTVLQAPGMVVEMPREQVEPDRHSACHRGLHAASFDFAEKFYPNGVLVSVVVNPKDVVAVPFDANMQKMRVCKYKILEVIGEPREEAMYDDESYDEGWYDECEDDWGDDEDGEDDESPAVLSEDFEDDPYDFG